MLQLLNTRMANRYLATTGYDVSVYMQVGNKNLGHPFQDMTELLYRLHEGVGVRHSAGHTLSVKSVNMAQLKANNFRMLIDLSTYPEAPFSRRSLESQCATLHVENWAATDALAWCVSLPSHQAVFKVDQDGVRAFS